MIHPQKSLLLTKHSGGGSMGESVCVMGFSLTDQDISTVKAIKPCLTIFKHHSNIPHKIPTCNAGWAS